MLEIQEGAGKEGRDGPDGGYRYDHFTILFVVLLSPSSNFDKQLMLLT